MAGRNINNLRYADATTLMAESEEELKNLLIKVREESEKPGLKVNMCSRYLPAHRLRGRWGGEGKSAQTGRRRGSCGRDRAEVVSGPAPKPKVSAALEGGVGGGALRERYKYY